MNIPVCMLISIILNKADTQLTLEASWRSGENPCNIQANERSSRSRCLITYFSGSNNRGQEHEEKVETFDLLHTLQSCCLLGLRCLHVSITRERWTYSKSDLVLMKVITNGCLRGNFLLQI